jgi:hypothetical protein
VEHMSEIIERVALAISGSDDPANILAIHRSRAILAIEAMREPTMVMEYAASNWQGPQMTYSDVWRAMVDEALK